jgi:hypothetical protein
VFAEAERISEAAAGLGTVAGRTADERTRRMTEAGRDADTTTDRTTSVAFPQGDRGAYDLGLWSVL